MTKPSVFDWDVYRGVSDSMAERVLAELALLQWLDGNDLLEDESVGDKEKARFREGFRFGYFAGRVVGNMGADHGA